MFSSPPAKRTRGKTADKENIDRLYSDPADKKSKQPPTTSIMAPTVDEKKIEDVVKKCISGDSIVDILVSKLAEHVKSAVREAVEASLVPLNLEVSRLKDQVTQLTELVARQEKQVRCQLDDLQQYQRRNNVRVFGIPESQGEDTDKLVVDLCKEKLGVDMPVNAICRSHRVGPKTTPTQDGNPRHRPIIVKFVSYRDRRRVFEKKKKLKGTGLVIREDLTAARLEVFRRAASLYGGKRAWTMDGRVMWVDGGGKRGSAVRIEDLAEATNSH